MAVVWHFRRPRIFHIDPLYLWFLFLCDLYRYLQSEWDDYAIKSMVENGLRVGILPVLILQRIPYQVLVKELEVLAFRKIGIAMREQKSLSLAVKRFLEYLPVDRGVE